MSSKKDLPSSEDLWKNFVYKNHHKSRDLEYVVLKTGSFYDDSEWYVAIMPYPYLCNGPVISDAYQFEDVAITDLILRLFDYMEDWCREVLAHPNDYDCCQREQAEYFDSIQEEREELLKDLKLSRKTFSYRSFLETEIKDMLNLDYL